MRGEVYERPALAGVELEEDSQAVPELGVVLSQRVVPQQHQARQHLGAGDAAHVHELGQALGRLRPQVGHLEGDGMWSDWRPEERQTPLLCVSHSPHSPGTLTASAGCSGRCPRGRPPSSPPWWRWRPPPVCPGTVRAAPSEPPTPLTAAGSRTAAAGR